jgi:AcrR family transcriptional regulator
MLSTTCQDLSVATPQRSWRGVPPEERQLERRRRLFDAVLEISAAEGIASLTVRGICAQANLTSRYFYESFSDIGNLLTVLYDELGRSATARVIEGAVMPAGGLRERVRSGVSSGAAFFVEDPRTIRFLLVSATAWPDLNRLRRQLISDVTELSAAAVLHGSGLTTVPAQIQVTARFVIGGLIEVATALVEGDARYSLDELVDAATDVILDLIEHAIASLEGTSGLVHDV